MRFKSLVLTIARSPKLRFLIMLSLISILWNRLDIRQIILILNGFDGTMGLIMAAVNILLIFLFALRWQRIALDLDFKLPYANMVRATWLAAFLGQFGPTIVIAEATRFQMLRKYATMTQLVASQILDRVSGQIVLFAIVLLLIPFYNIDLKLSILKLLMCLVSFALLLSVIIRLRYRSMSALLQGATGKTIKLLGKKGLFSHYSLSLAIQSLLILNFTFAAHGLGVVDQLWKLILLTPLVFAVLTLLPISISDWGSRETASIILLAPTGLSAELIVSISVIYGLLHLFVALPGGLFLIRRPIHSR